MANIKIAYAASSNLTATGLNSLAASSTWLAGWESDAVDNTTNLYLDYLVTAKIVSGGVGIAAGQLRCYVVGMLSDSAWPDVFDGTAGGVTVTDSEIRDGFAKLGAATDVDTGQGDTYYLGPFSVAALFGGVCPAKFVLFITHSTSVALASSGHQVTVKGVYATVA